MTPTPEDVLDLEIDFNGFFTVRGYLKALLTQVWQEGEMFDGKRPFGMGGWYDDLYVPLVKAGWIKGKFDNDGYLDSCDTKAGDELILSAIEAM